MPDEELINQELTSAGPSAQGSAEDELLPTSEASKLAGTSARTLKRRADLGMLRRTSVHTQFGVEKRYYKKELEKLRQEMQQKSAEVVAEVVAEVDAELKGRRADGAELQVAGGDTKLRSVADLAEVSKVIDQKISKATEPFFRLADSLETGFDKLLCFQQRMIDIEINRDEERKQEKEAILKAKEQEKQANLARLVCYLIATLVFCGFVVYTTWMLYTGKLFRW